MPITIDKYNSECISRIIGDKHVIRIEEERTFDGCDRYGPKAYDYNVKIYVKENSREVCYHFNKYEWAGYPCDYELL
jgi:hypothetical protein